MQANSDIRNRAQQELLRLKTPPIKLEGALAEVNLLNHNNLYRDPLKAREGQTEAELTTYRDLKLLSMGDEKGSSEAWYDGKSNDRVGQILAVNSVPPQELLERAVAFIAARYLAVGSPQREQVARQFSEMPIEEQKKGIKVKRVKAKELKQAINRLTIQSYKSEQANVAKTQFESEIASGKIREEFLYPEETIPFKALEVMINIVRENIIGDRNAREWSKDFGHRSIGPVKCDEFTYHDYQHAPLPWHIRDWLNNNGDTETANFFDRLEKYAGHPWGAENTDFFASPSFGEGMGDGAATETLSIFKNGAIAHIANSGKHWAEPGIIIPEGSNIDLRTESQSFDDSRIRVYPYQKASLLDVKWYAKDVKLLDRDTIIKSRSYPGDSFHRKGTVVDSSGLVISNPKKADKKILIIENEGKPRRATFGEVTSMLKGSS
jgi:hypothetical protein